MSDAIVVMVTKSNPVDLVISPKEYRVAYLPDFDALFVKFNDDTAQLDVNIDMVLDSFAEVTIWTDVDRAFEEADNIFFNLGHEPEYGIVYFSHLEDKIFTEL